MQSPTPVWRTLVHSSGLQMMNHSGAAGAISPGNAPASKYGPFLNPSYLVPESSSIYPPTIENPPWRLPHASLEYRQGVQTSAGLAGNIFTVCALRWVSVFAAIYNICCAAASPSCLARLPGCSPLDLPDTVSQTRQLFHTDRPFIWVRVRLV